MKVLLVEPPKVIWEMMRPYVLPPLGLAQLAAVLERNDINVSVLRCIFQLSTRILIELDSATSYTV
jgi:hypothetical protein